MRATQVFTSPPCKHLRLNRHSPNSERFLGKHRASDWPGQQEIAFGASKEVFGSSVGGTLARKPQCLVRGKAHLAHSAIEVAEARATPHLDLMAADYYRKHAARVRALAAETTTTALKDHLDDVARQYDALAERADDIRSGTVASH